MRIVKRRLLLLALAALSSAPWACRPLVKEVFESPKVKLIDVGLAGNPFLDPKGPFEAVLHLQVTNPNSYALNVADVSYSASIGTETVAEGERKEKIRIEPSGDTMVKVPVTLRPEAFAPALKQILAARAIPYEFRGSVGVVAPVVGTVHVPFSKSGTIDPVDVLRRKGIVFN